MTEKYNTTNIAIVQAFCYHEQFACARHPTLQCLYQVIVRETV
jgi:hypothetical protein